MEQRRGLCICLWKCAPPLRQRVCPWRDRGREGSEGAQVIEVSPPLPSPPFFFFFIPGFLAPSFRPLCCPIYTAGTITLPITPPAGPRDPALLTKCYSIGPLPLNLSEPAPGEWLAAHKTEGWGGSGGGEVVKQFQHFQHLKHWKNTEAELNTGRASRFQLAGVARLHWASTVSLRISSNQYCWDEMKPSVQIMSFQIPPNRKHLF